MPRVDQVFAAKLAQALDLAGWGVCEAAGRAGITQRILSDARAGNCILSNGNVRRLIEAMIKEGQVPAAMLLASQYFPVGWLVRFPGARNDLNRWGDEIDAMLLVVGTAANAIEDGAVTRRELDDIRQALHVATGMMLDQIDAVDERLKAEQKQRAPRIAGAPLRKTG